jgi:hypothetical protein
MQRVGCDRAAVEPARELLGVEHVRELRHRVLAHARERSGRPPDRLEVDPGRAVVRAARDVHDPGGGALEQPVEQQAREVCGIVKEEPPDADAWVEDRTSEE